MRIVASLALGGLTLAWLVFALAGLFPLFLLDADDYDLVNLSAVLSVYAVAPLFLVFAWSFNIQRHFPTRRQVAIGLKVLSIILLLVILLVVAGVAVGWLFDNTTLNG